MDLSIFFVFLAVPSSINAFPKPGKTDYELVLTPGTVIKVQYRSMVMSLHPGAVISFGGLCHDFGNSGGGKVNVSYRLLTSRCAGFFDVHTVLTDPDTTALSAVTPWVNIPVTGCSFDMIHPVVDIAQSPPWRKICQAPVAKGKKRTKQLRMPSPGKVRMAPICTARRFDVYAIVFRAEVAKASTSSMKRTVRLHVEMRNTWGYLSAVDIHSYLFYQYMTGVYSIFAILWTLMMMCQWRDLLQLQFWIAGVIAVGMVEKAVFLASYHRVNENGSEGEFLISVAELISAVKRTLARLLIIVVSAGFGIVKPRLGAIRPYVVLVGAVFFLLSSSEGMHHSSFHSESTPSRSYVLLSFALLLLDAVIIVWVFILLRETIALLALRRNPVKLSLYTNFVRVLVVTVLVSAAFLFYWIWKVSPLRCVQNWPLLWMERGFWHILFSCVLLAIMLLWRPSANNIRYAYSAHVESHEAEGLVQDTAGTSDQIKLRNGKNAQVSERSDSSADDELRWVEENIPSALASSILDDEGDKAHAIYEVSKMQ